MLKAIMSIVPNLLHSITIYIFITFTLLDITCCLKETTQLMIPCAAAVFMLIICPTGCSKTAMIDNTIRPGTVKYRINIIYYQIALISVKQTVLNKLNQVLRRQ